MSELYKSLKRASRTKNEFGDCGVIALSVIAQIDYDDAYNLLKKYGRKDRGPTCVSRYMFPALEELGLSHARILPSVFKQFGKTVRTFERNCPLNDPFLIWTNHENQNSHILGMINGEVHDWSKGSCQRIRQMWMISS